MKIVIKGNPATKKNSMRVYGKRVLPSKAYCDYEKNFIKQCKEQNLEELKLNEYYNVKCIYYKQTRIRCDLNNLLEATTDCLVASGILEDDNCLIIGGHDGSRVRYDKENPRVEITIEELKEEKCW